jgi:hypothetical protein
VGTLLRVRAVPVGQQRLTFLYKPRRKIWSKQRDKKDEKSCVPYQTLKGTEYVFGDKKLTTRTEVGTGI